MMSKQQRKLTAKQDRFCQEYMIDLNATQAAIRAGYSKNRACEIGYQQLRKTTVLATIEKLQKQRAERVELNADAVLLELKRLIDKAGSEVETETGTTLDNYSAYAKGIELAMKHNGMLLDRREITGKNGGSIVLTDTERAAKLQAILDSVD